MSRENQALHRTLKKMTTQQNSLFDKNDEDIYARISKMDILFFYKVREDTTPIALILASQNERLIASMHTAMEKYSAQSRSSLLDLFGIGDMTILPRENTARSLDIWEKLIGLKENASQRSILLHTMLDQAIAKNHLGLLEWTLSQHDLDNPDAAYTTLVNILAAPPSTAQDARKRAIQIVWPFLKTDDVVQKLRTFNPHLWVIFCLKEGWHLPDLPPFPTGLHKKLHAVIHSAHEAIVFLNDMGEIDNWLFKTMQDVEHTLSTMLDARDNAQEQAFSV